jgi:hypothetical protein
MPKASPNHSGSLSSIAVDLIVNNTGIADLLREVVSPVARQSLETTYTARVQEAASTPELWGDQASSIRVSIPDNTSVIVEAAGSENDVYKAHELEFGTPSTPPKAVMRTFQESLTYDLVNDMGSIGL